MRILFLLAVVASFFWGVVTYKYKIFPFNILQTIFKKMNGTPTPSSKTHLINFDQIKLRLDNFKDSAPDTRELITRRTIIDSHNVTVREKELGNDEYQVSAKFYGITINGVLKKTSGAKCLTIYIQGHGGNPFDFDYHNTLRSRTLADNCDFLSLSMLGIGLNSGPTSFPSRIAGTSTVELSSNATAGHRNYSFFRDKNAPHKDPLSLFLSGHYYLIKNLSEDYEHISMIGISGGGWYTTWLAALVPNINVSISYAGSLPLAYRINDRNHGDWEQVNSDVYDEIDYWELYLLGTMDQKFNVERDVFLVYNNKDDCCFMDPDASHFAGMLKKLDFPRISAIVVNSEVHSINPDVAYPILKNSRLK